MEIEKDYRQNIENYYQEEEDREGRGRRKNQ
jgi:hypothetical protein